MLALAVQHSVSGYGVEFMTSRFRLSKAVPVLSFIDNIFSVERVLSFSPQPELLLWFANNKYSLGKLRQSARLYEVAAEVELKGRNRADVLTQALIGQGLAELKLDRLEAAEGSFKNALQIGAPGASGQFSETLNNLARLADLRRRLRSSTGWKKQLL